MELNAWWKKHQRKIIFGGGGLLFTLLLLVIFRLTFLQPVAPVSLEQDERERLSQFSSEETEAIELIAFADIKGAVVAPGMYQINENTRLQDLISLAGGLTSEAESRHLNFSLLIQDQMMVYVPFQGEAYSEEESEMVVSGNTTPSQGGNKGVNLNTADVSELQTLSGIGPKKAEAIIAYREEAGSFKTIEDLMEVGGIGEKTFENLKSEITVK